jgi:predicted nucleic acid-binding protein
MEILYSARSSAEYIAFEMELDGFRILRNDRAVADAAMSAIGELAEHSDGYHRVPLTDALIAAAAAEHGGIAVLHRDTHLNQARRSPRIRERRASRILTALHARPTPKPPAFYVTPRHRPIQSSARALLERALRP